MTYDPEQQRRLSEWRENIRRSINNRVVFVIGVVLLLSVAFTYLKVMP